MLALPDLQDAFRDALLDGKARRLLREIENRRIGAAGALAIYRNHVRISLTAALRTTFPVVCKLVDERFFAFAAHAYIQAQPPSAPCLAEYGSGFPDFLAGFAPCRGLPYLADVARLEWALNLAQIAPHASTLDRAALAALAPETLPRVVFAFAPSIRLLASSYAIDRIWFANQEPVQPGGFMAQTGDPRGTGTGGSGQKLPAEFSREPFQRGTVGMARAQDPNSGDSQFFIMFARGDFLDGKYTVWGRVVQGMEFVDKIKRGEPPRNPDKIIRMQVAADAK